MDKMGLIFNLQRFSLHDGPGIRDLIFMKGCPLRCPWCCNPESHNAFQEISYSPNQCLGWEECGRCIEACPRDAASRGKEGKIRIDREVCDCCGRCAEICPSQSLRILGEFWDQEGILKIVEEDSPFYLRSGGGITIGGGEPLSQAEFVAALLEECQGRGIDTAVETSGYGSWEDMRKLCRHANGVIYDLKCLDSKKHQHFIGVPNERILENLRQVSRQFPQVRILVRTPVIAGFNDSEEEIEAIVDFLTKVGNMREYDLLPYHGLGETKYAQLGREYPCHGLQPPPQERFQLLQKITGRLGGKTNNPLPLPKEGAR